MWRPKPALLGLGLATCRDSAEPGSELLLSLHADGRKRFGIELALQV